MCAAFATAMRDAALRAAPTCGRHIRMQRERPREPASRSNRGVAGTAAKLRGAGLSVKLDELDDLNTPEKDAEVDKRAVLNELRAKLAQHADFGKHVGKAGVVTLLKFIDSSLRSPRKLQAAADAVEKAAAQGPVVAITSHTHTTLYQPRRPLPYSLPRDRGHDWWRRTTS